MKRFTAVLGLSLVLSVAGCRKSAPAPTVAAGQPAKTFTLRGRIVSTNAAHGEVTVAHQAIPGFMGAMTMPYKLVQPEILSELHPGDTITAQLLVDKDSDGYLNPRLDHVVIVGQTRPDYKPQSQYHVPEPGESVPDFKLLNQSGKTIHLGGFKGKAVLLTFIYTRCPLADYCPRMSTNFAQIDKALAAEPKLYGSTHLLSISFDPAYDTPAVLRSYGGAHTGQFTNETFKHWDFAAPSAADLTDVEHYFDVGVTPGDDRTLNHSMATALIGKDGKVVAFYPSNDWQVEDVLAKLKEAAL
ncbi:redoxin domain-containing protein [Granulicella sp. WH15]|uniref:SCO family protein n=1 Tax=Granulicella sp. WH15 TaxID=2602070 RepID=UPI0013675A9F|nr:SCO family protein [Granulicella sp. WH15]QHN04217.1 redoxin domain-containing protein [Granulicella sp. WH15]